VAVIVFGGRAGIPSIDAMRFHVGALVGCDMNNNGCAGKSKGALVEGVDAIETGVGGKSWLASGRTQEIERDVGLRHEEAAFSEGNLGSHVARPEQKWFFQVWIARSAELRWWLCCGTRWKQRCILLRPF
jgi:hypothetical protein